MIHLLYKLIFYKFINLKYNYHRQQPKVQIWSIKQFPVTALRNKQGRNVQSNANKKENVTGAFSINLALYKSKTNDLTKHGCCKIAKKKRMILFLPYFKSIHKQINYQMSQSKKINPELSVLNEKNELKKIETNVQTMKNRVELLRIQLQKEKDGVKKHKQLTKQTIQKKVEVNKIQQWKEKDNSEEIERLQYLRRKNQDLRASHEKELQDIQKAIYLVKLDDAREVKNISQEHNKRLKEMEYMFLSEQRQRKQKVAEESMMAKEKYMKFWKDKLANIYTEQAHTIIEVGKQKEDKKKELQNLEEEQLRLMEAINKHHSQGVESKKEYLAALSLPVKQVAQAMSNSNNASMLSRRKSTTLNTSAIVDYSSQTARYSQKDAPKLPNAQVNQDKLKVILQQLKKIDRNSIHTSR